MHVYSKDSLFNKAYTCSKGLTITEGLTWDTRMAWGAHQSLKLYAKSQLGYWHVYFFGERVHSLIRFLKTSMTQEKLIFFLS